LAVLTQINQLNFMAIVVAAITAQIMAIIWYLPPLFGLRWARLIKGYSGLTDETLGANLGRKVLLWFVGFLINAFALALLLRAAHSTTNADAIALAVTVWVGLAAVISSWPSIHAGFPWGVWLMNNAIYLLIQIVLSIILTRWQ
jgi:hypothetical protein